MSNIRSIHKIFENIWMQSASKNEEDFKLMLAVEEESLKLFPLFEIV